MKKRLRLYGAAYKALCDAVHTRDRWKCRVTGCKARTALHAHHIRFKSQQGDDASYNLVTVCNHCHDKIHDRWILCIAKSGDVYEEVNADKGIKWVFVNRWTPK